MAVNQKKAHVLDADIAGCFNNIDHQALLRKLNASTRVRRTIRSWLKTGVVDGKTLYPTEAGTPQGGVISPRLANIALHGMEAGVTEQIYPELQQWTKEKYGRKRKRNASTGFSVIRYADDFVIIHESGEVIAKAKQLVEEWLKGIGLGVKGANLNPEASRPSSGDPIRIGLYEGRACELKGSKTQITHTLEGKDPGFNFLGFNIRQYRVNQGRGYKTLIKPSKKAQKEHLKAISEILDGHRSAPQATVINRLNPVITGWSRYFSNGVSVRFVQPKG